MQLTKKFSADELCKEIFFAVAFEKYSLQTRLTKISLSLARNDDRSIDGAMEMKEHLH